MYTVSQRGTTTSTRALRAYRVKHERVPRFPDTVSTVIPFRANVWVEMSSNRH